MVSWTLLFLLLVSFTRINILKITVLAGTFALAMAFAGNDLVNFIGVPLAGFEAFKTFIASGASDAGGLYMEALREPVDTPIYFLISAGLIMVLTLRFSKKARSVTATTIDLSRQSEGSERFASSSLARFIESRFDAEKLRDEVQGKHAFDLVRASVNLVVASILIAIGTLLKLPLSTTYVTFMVAMGTSLADGAWGRDSAVYRITGVLTVIGGWFFTAFIAFLASLLIASLIFVGKLPVILILIGLAIFILLRTHTFHRKKVEHEKKVKEEISLASFEALQSCDAEVINSIVRVARILNLTYTNFFKEKHKELKKLKKESKQLTKEIKQIREDIPDRLKKFNETDLISGHHYVQVVTYMKEISNSLLHIVLPAFNHLDNNHAFDKEPTEKLRDFNDRVSEFFNFVVNLLKKKDYVSLPELVNQRREIINLANEILISRIVILKKNKNGVKVSATYMEMLSETKNLLLDVVQLVKADLKLLDSATPVEESVGEEMLD